MATFTVTNTNDRGEGSLRQAILNSNAAGSADRIVFDSSLTGETINLTSGEIRIDDDLIIEGLGADNLTIDAGGNSRIFRTVSGFNGLLSGPGDSTDITIKDLTLTGGNTQSSGGAILALRSSLTSTLNLTVIDSNLSGNTAGESGGAIFGGDRIDESITIINSTLSENTAGTSGGAIFADRIDLNGSTISGNSATLGGGGVFAREALGVLDSDFTNNTTEGVGGGLAALSLIAAGSTFDGNSAGTNGGGLAVLGATTILFSSITNNESDLDGGGITIGQIDSPLIFGGDRTAFISNSTISGNQAKRNGGGIEIIGDIVQLIPPTEGLAQGANLVANNVTIANNTSDSNNDGSGDGGGIWNTPSAAFGDFDTERFIWIPADVSFENSIIAGNFDTPNNNGSGFMSPDISGAAKGNANNLLGDDRGLTIETGVASAAESLGAGTDLRNIDPRLEELQDNGGFGLTHALMPDSPALNGGDNTKILRETLIDVDGDGIGQVLNFDDDPNTTDAPSPYDQRFFSRVVGGTIDIGAFELPIPDNLNLRGTSGNDSLIGADGNDTLTGLAGNDLLTGNDGQDRLVAGSGNDTLDGGNSRDTLLGGGGGDLLSGGADRDVLRGGGGDDTLTGGAGNDVLRGDAGNDVLVLEIGQGRDTIRNFQDDIDRLGLSDGLSFSDLTISSNSANTSTIIRDSNNNAIANLPGLDSTLITEVDFVEV